jgi:HEAT repeat protein
MKSWKFLVRGGASRPAPGGTLVPVIGGMLLLTGAGVSQIRKAGSGEVRKEARTQFFRASTLPEVRWQQQQDSANVRAFLARVRGVDPTICHLMSRAVGNRWGGWHSVDAIGPYAAAGVDRLLAWLDTRDVQSELVPLLRAALQDEDVCVRRTAAQLLGRARVTNLAAELGNELSSASAATREAALIAVGHFDRISGVAPARTALRDPDVSVRVAAAWVLGVLEGNEANSALMDAARDPDARVRSTVAWALGEIENADAIPVLVRMLESDRDVQVRRAAAGALGRIGG